MSERLDVVRSFLAQHHRAVLVTRKRDGSPQASPVAVGVDSEGRACVSSRRMLDKVANLRRDPRASLCVVTDAWFGPWLQADGAAEVVELPGALEPLVELYRQVGGEHPDWDEYREAMRREERVLIRVELGSAAGPALD